MSGSFPERFVNPDDNRKPIQPYAMVTTKTIKSFSIRVVSLELFTSVTVVVSLFEESGAIVENRTIRVEGDEYLAWNNDDAYLVNLVASKLGFTLA